ncbi:MAG: DNA (cytosine-5-)-methyltransferase [Bacilli bacterium]
MQFDIFDLTMNTFKLDKDKPIKVFEAFSGVGMQRMALNRMGVPYESVGYSEIDKFAIQSYNAIHNDDNNFGDICKIKGADLPQIDLFTYSFPCTDLSKAGQQKGLNNTRSGLVYEVIRILQELKNKNSLPTVLLMENVVDLVQTKFIKQFNEIQAELEALGYINHTQVLNAKDYGVAQNRERVFMISILGNYNYKFPKVMELKKSLKDYLQPFREIEEKYYLSDKALATFTDTTNRNGFVRGDRFNPHDRDSEYAFCVTTREACVATSNYIKEVGGGDYP